MTVATQLPTGTWTADPVHSSIGFAVKHFGVSTFRAGFTELDASLQVSGDDGIALVGTVPVESIDVRQPELRAHLLTPDFFDVERHPEIRFASTAVRRGEGESVTVEGDLTINGITGRVEAQGTLGEPGVGIDGSARVAVELEAVVDRTEFGLGWNAPLPNGKQVLADDVRLLVVLELTPEG